jgi:hypothetical protein
MTGWVGFDLDGTLAEYGVDGPYLGPRLIGRPIEPIIAVVKSLLMRGDHVKIVTARVSSNSPDSATARKTIEFWCAENLGEVLPITSEKDYQMVELWDGHSVQVLPNEGIPVQDVLVDALRLLSSVLEFGNLPSGLRYNIESFIDGCQARGLTTKKVI